MVAQSAVSLPAAAAAAAAAAAWSAIAEEAKWAAWVVAPHCHPAGLSAVALVVPLDVLDRTIDHQT